jgi:acyl-CoA reductase-like NAD-dependent aldehyde dehydrogenase
MDPDTDVGPLISRDDRDRVKEWIDEAAAGGGEVLTGGELTDEDRCLEPTVIREPSREARVWCDEIFGPVATVHSFGSFDEAIELANDARFGLQAGVFTSDVELALEAGRRLDFGGVLINEVPTFRADQMPYGGVKESGNTREGPAYAVRELTEERLITLQG